MSTPASSSSALVADAMHAPVLTCGPETPVRQVAALMAGECVHAIVVVGIERTAWSAVTAHDLLATPVEEAGVRTAREVAGTEALTVPLNATLDQAARLLVEHEVDHAIVVDADGVPAGVVSSLDLVRRLA